MISCSSTLPPSDLPLAQLREVPMVGKTQADIVMGLPTLDRSRYAAADGLRRGAYVLCDSAEGEPDLILIATGSEVGLIVAAAERLQAQGVAVRCVSMPSWELFDAMPQAERDRVLPRSVHARLAVEAGVAQGWHRYVGDAGDVLSVERFGASAPGDVMLREYGFNVEEVYRRALTLHASGRQADQRRRR